MIAEKEITSWATWMRAAGRPGSTIYLRTYHVRRTFMEMPDADPLSVTTEDLVVWLGSKTWKPNTRRSNLTSLRVFFTWAQATGRRQDNPAALMPTVKVPRGMPRPTPDVIYRTALLEADDREQLMVQLAAKCGLRRGEIARTRVDEVVEDLVGYSLRVVGKGGHERLVPLPDELARTIREQPAGWLFPSPSRNGGHLTAPHVGKIISRLLPDGWSCHTLRHRCATVAYASTRDLRAIQELLGHAKPETTARYTQVPQDAIRAAVRAAAA